MIVTYLIKALSEKDSVYISNLGLFGKQYQAAQIRDGQITAPFNKVVLDTQFEGNGFNFVMFVSQKGGFLINESTEKINQWVNDLKNALDNNKSVSFEKFGTFAKNEKGIITFECDKIAELNTDFEGFDNLTINHSQSACVEENAPVTDKPETPVQEIDVPIVAPTVEQITEFKAEEEISDNNPASEKISTETEIETETESHTIEPEPEAETDPEPLQEEMVQNEELVEQEDEDIVQVEDQAEPEEDISDEEDTPKKKRPWLVILIIVIILAILAAAAYFFKGQLLELYHQYFDKKQMETTVVEPENQEPIAQTIYEDNSFDSDSTDLTNSEENNPTDNNGSWNTSSSETNQIQNTTDFYINFEKGKHYVIAGSFRSEQEVRRHIKERHLEQYTPKVVRQEGIQNLRICIGIFDSEEAAEAFGQSTKLNYWVLN